MDTNEQIQQIGERAGQAVEDLQAVRQALNYPLAKSLAYNWVNILSVVPVIYEGSTDHYIIMFEYHFSTPKLEGWRKYAISWGGVSGRFLLEDGVECCYRLAKQLKEEIESDPSLQ